MSATTLDRGDVAAPTRRLTLALALGAFAALALGLWRHAESTTRSATWARAAAALGVQARDAAIPAAALAMPLELPPAGAAPALLAPALAAALAEADVVLLHFWATWCPPCLEELAGLARLGAALRAAGREVAIVAVSYDDDWPTMRRTLQEHAGDPQPPGVRWLRDPQGQEGDTALMLRTAFGTEKLPETYVLQGGKVRGLLVGAQRWDRAELVRYLDAVAALP